MQAFEAQAQAARISKLESDLQDACKIINDIAHSPLFATLNGTVVTNCSNFEGPDNKTYQNWTAQEVEKWIRSHKLPEEHIDLFVQQNINGKLLPWVTDVNLVAVGIPLGSALQIVIAITEMIGKGNSKWFNSLSSTYNSGLYAVSESCDVLG